MFAPSKEKFNILVIIFSTAFILSIFSQFSVSLGIYAALFIILSVTFTFFFNNFAFNLSNYFLPVLLFVVNAVVSFYFADCKYNVRNEIFLLSSSAILYLLAGFLNNYEKRNILIIPVIIGLWLTIYLFALNFGSMRFLEVQIITRHMMAVSNFLLIALCLSFIFWWDKNKIYFYISFIIFFAIIITKSLLAIGIAGVIFALYLFFIREKIRIKAFITIMPFVVISTVSFYFLFKFSFFCEKILIWKTILPVIKDNFLFGVGFCNYKTVAHAYNTLGNIDITHVDNIFLQVLIENGIFGFIFFIAMLTVFFYFIFNKLSNRNSGKNLENRCMYLPVLMAVTAFLIYNFFDSSVFVSTNILLFFFLLAFPIASYNVESRKKKINSYMLIILLLPLAVFVGKPLYAIQEYKNGLSFYASQKYSSAEECFINASSNDSLNPEYTSRLADVYFSFYQKNGQKSLLDFAIDLSKMASGINKYNGKYYHQLAWLYHFKDDREQATVNITKAIEKDMFNSSYWESYKILT